MEIEKKAFASEMCHCIGATEIRQMEIRLYANMDIRLR